MYLQIGEYKSWATTYRELLTFMNTLWRWWKWPKRCFYECSNGHFETAITTIPSPWKTRTVHTTGSTDYLKFDSSESLSIESRKNPCPAKPCLAFLLEKTTQSQCLPRKNHQILLTISSHATVTTTSVVSSRKSLNLTASVPMSVQPSASDWKIHKKKRKRFKCEVPGYGYDYARSNELSEHKFTVHQHGSYTYIARCSITYFCVVEHLQK